MTKDFFTDFIKDVKTDLMDEFDRNFERKAFFDQNWPREKYPNHTGSLLMRTGGLRRSIKAEIQGNTIRFSSSLPYAGIHNNGGTIVVTEKMKRYFWAMYLKASGAVKGKGSGDRTRRFSTEAEFWKAMALKKAGARIRIPARPFIGHHREVDKAIEQAGDRMMKKLNESLINDLKP